MIDKKAGSDNKERGMSYKNGRSKGFSAILLAVFIPIIVLGVRYLVEYTSKSNVDTSDFKIPYAIGVNLAKSFNPGKTWSEQKTYLYSIAAQTYNDEAIDTNKQLAFTPSSVLKIKGFGKSLSIESLYDFYKNYCTEGRELSGQVSADEMFIRSPISDFIYNEVKKTGTYVKYSDNANGNGMVVYESGKYKENKDKLQLSLNNKGQILVSCKELKKQAVVDIPRHNVDIVIAIPTNRASNTVSNDNKASFGDYSNVSTADSTPIKQIARACQSFLKPFLHTAGVAVGIIPYSGKVTMSPYSDCENYTVQIPMNSAPPTTLSYAVQAMFYASDGSFGGNIVTHGSGADTDFLGNYKDWGSSQIGLPIMARRGQLYLYRDMLLNSGAISGKTGISSLLLDMKTSPMVGDDYKFMRMNTNPCYLGFCNTLAMTCEKDCPNYMANPYFMTELTSDIQSLIHDLELFVPFKDEKNKSNFLFLPLVMAGNMFSWGNHPSTLPKTGRVVEPNRADKARAVVIIANAPDNFEPQEMTYLGFNNDYSEIPMIESDTILFNADRGYQLDANGNYMGVKGAVKFSASGTLDKSKGFNLSGKARISFPNKGILRIVAEKGENSEVKVYSDNGVVDNVGHVSFAGSKTLNFRGPQQVRNYGDLGTKFQTGNYTTKGPNFGHNLSVRKVKIGFSGCKLIRARLSNQILRFYGQYFNENGKPLIENTSGSAWSGCPENIRKKMDPCIDVNLGYDSSTNGWTYNTNGYIEVRKFQPMCYGVSKINQFVCAANNFPVNAQIIPEDVKVYDGSRWYDIGNIYYNTSKGTMYRCFTDCYFYPSTLDYIRMDTGQFNIYSHYYYKKFASQKTRTRTLKQRITTIRNYPTTSVPGCKCCQPNAGLGGAYDNTVPMPCNDVVYLHPDAMTYSQSGWTEYHSTKYECAGNDQPQTYNISEFRKPQTLVSTSCSYNEGEIGNSKCSYPASGCEKSTDSGCDWIRSIGDYSHWWCVNCTRASEYNCWAGCSRRGSRDVDIPSWEERISQYKRLYARYERNSDGSLKPITYQVCDDRDGGHNCTSTTYSGSQNFDNTGIEDTARRTSLAFKFNLYNFFFVNSNEKVSDFSYSGNTLNSNKITSVADANVLRNKGVYLLPDGKDYWVCFCGDADLKLDFQDTSTDASISFSNIEKDQYRIAFDNTGTISSTVGVSKVSVGDKQVFYIIPEQIKNNLDADGNYYVELSSAAGKLRIVSVELSNRPYKMIEPSAKIVGADENNGKATGDGTNEYVEFKTNLRTSFSYSAAPIYFWIEGDSDFRQKSGTAKICGNSDKVKNGIVQVSVPDTGSGKITLKRKDMGEEYEVISDRKVKRIYNISTFILPKATFTGAVNKICMFGTKEMANETETVNFPSSSFSHKPFDEKKDWNNYFTYRGGYISSGPKYEATFLSSKKQQIINFELKSCLLKQIYAKNLVMKFSPTINDFPSIYVRSRYWCHEPVRYDDKGFYADTSYYGPPYGVEIDLGWAYDEYGSGTITAYGYKNSGAADMYLYVNGDSSSFSSVGNYSKSGSCTGSSVAKSKVYYSGSKGGPCNYLTASEYKLTLPYDLTKKMTYTTNDTTNDNYKGSIPFYGVADIQIDIVPKKKKLSEKFSKNIPENEISGVFGNYKWLFSELAYALNLDSEELKVGTHFDLAYTDGTFGGTNIPAGTTKMFEDQSTTQPYKGYFCNNVNVKNAVLSIPMNRIYLVDGRSLATPKPGILSSETFIISPDTHEFELQNDGYFHVKVPCRNVYISDVKAVDSTKVRVYDHPNIIKNELKNTRIIDGFDIDEYERSTVSRMKKYGNINYNGGTVLPSVSPVQRLFYNTKGNNSAVYLYPKASESGSASTGEEGDFFIQLWDHNNEVPAVKWKIGSSIQSDKSDISMLNSGFSAFKSNYAFNGLHRMFFPYDIYDKNYAGYSYALHSALVFAGYTLPINLILANSGYQTTYSLSSGQVSNHTKPNTALSNLAKDACSRLKTDLNDPTVYLVKYRVKSDVTLSLESCVSDKYTYATDNETDLTDILIHIAKEIKQNSQDDILRINVKDLK